MKRYTILLLAFGSIAMVSCKKTDRDRPTFTITSPADSSVYNAGQNIPFVANFSDNENLSQYKIDIHDNFDGHNHDKYLAKIWNQIFIENISGPSFSENKNILVPDSSASGWYHFLVTAVDEAGNQSEVTFRNIFIRNTADTIAPVVNFTSPLESSSLALGDDIDVSAGITDNERVYIVNTRVRRPNSGNNLFLKADTFGTNTVTYNQMIPTDGSAWSTGAYELTFTVYDSYYNRYSKVVNFQLN